MSCIILCRYTYILFSQRFLILYIHVVGVSVEPMEMPLLLYIYTFCSNLLYPFCGYLHAKPYDYNTVAHVHTAVVVHTYHHIHHVSPSMKLSSMVISAPLKNTLCGVIILSSIRSRRKVSRALSPTSCSRKSLTLTTPLTFSPRFTQGETE